MSFILRITFTCLIGALLIAPLSWGQDNGPRSPRSNQSDEASPAEQEGSEDSNTSEEEAEGLDAHADLVGSSRQANGEFVVGVASAPVSGPDSAGPGVQFELRVNRHYILVGPEVEFDRGDFEAGLISFPLQLSLRGIYAEDPDLRTRQFDARLRAQIVGVGAHRLRIRDENDEPVFEMHGDLVNTGIEGGWNRILGIQMAASTVNILQTEGIVRFNIGSLPAYACLGANGVIKLGWGIEDQVGITNTESSGDEREYGVEGHACVGVALGRLGVLEDRFRFGAYMAEINGPLTPDPTTRHTSHVSLTNQLSLRNIGGSRFRMGYQYQQENFDSVDYRAHIFQLGVDFEDVSSLFRGR